MDLLYFVLFVSILIFIHEFGHFVFAKLFGVKVITFSIGFGPKVLKVRGKETEYCVGILPFGGFVKMLEEGKAESPILPEERQRTFEAQALWKRVVIVLAGPAMNLVFPVALYTSVYLDDREFLPPTVGAVFPGKPADGKLFAGDIIKAIDGDKVESFPDVQKALRRAGVAHRIEVERDGKTIDVNVTPTDEVEVVEPKELELFEHVGRIGIAPTFAAPVIGIARTDSPAFRAGLRTFDRITAVNGRKVETFVDLLRVLSQNKGDNVVLTYVRPTTAPRALGGLADIAVLEPGIASLAPRSHTGDASTAKDADPDARAKDVLERTGIESAEMYVAYVPEGSSEWQMGLRSGDRVVMLDGQAHRMWKVDRRGGSVLDDTTMVGQLLRDPNRVHELVWSRDGQRMSGTFQLRKERWDDEFGQPYERYVFRTTHWMPRAQAKLVPNPHPWFYAIKRGAFETGNAIKFIVVGFVRIMQRRVSIAAIGGPITLYDVAGDAGAHGATTFVWAMAVTSVNLGLINLLPIPVLDGGHLMLLLVEWVRRKPVSVRARALSSLVGVSILGLLMLVAFRNDVSRKLKWQDIVVQVREIVN